MIQQDFANPPSKSSYRRHYRYHWAIGIAIALGLTVSLYCHHHQQHHTTAPRSTPHLPRPTQTTPPQHNQFEFYSLLSKLKVTTPDAQPHSKISTNQYLLQASVSQNKKGAKLFADELATFGYPAWVKSMETSGITYFAVVIGPYQTESMAKSDQSKLIAQNINSLLLEPAAGIKKTRS